MNIIRESFKSNGYFRIRPVTVVHDSSTSQFNAERIFEIEDFYYKHMNEFLYSKSGVRYKFGTYVGKNYFDVCSLTTIEHNKLIELSGNASSINYILDELDNVNLEYKIIEISNKSEVIGNDRKLIIPEKKNSVVEAFLLKYGECVYDVDYSKYSIKLEKL